MTEWKVLARSDDGVGVSRCPEGHIHLELERGEVTVRFDDEHFLAFADTVAMAAAAVRGTRWASPFGIRRNDRLPPN